MISHVGQVSLSIKMSVKYRLVTLISLNIFFNPYLRTSSLLLLERERKREGEGERVKEKHVSVASQMCLAWGSNPQPSGVQDGAPTN